MSRAARNTFMLFLGLLAGMACGGLMAMADPIPGDPAADAAPSASAGPVQATLDGPALLAGGGGSTLWVCRRDAPSRFTMLLHLPDTPPHHLWEGLKSNGRPQALAAFGAQAYIVYDDNSMQAIGYIRTADPTQKPFATRQLPPLPDGSTLVNVAAGRSGPVVLVRWAAPVAATDEAGTGDTPASPPAASSPPAVLRFTSAGWSKVELPEAVAKADRLMVVMVDAGSDDWAVVAQEPDADHFAVWRYRDEQWARQAYEGALDAAAQAVGVQHHVVLVEPADRTHLKATLLRRGSTIALGTIALADGARAWQALGVGNALAVLMRDGAGNLSQATRDPSTAADVISVSDPLTVTEMPQDLDENAIAMMIVLVAATLILLATWRRGPTGQRVELPPSVRPAEIWRRVVAALIDLVPGLVIVMFAFGIGDPARVLLENWPGMGPGNWQQMLPALLVIAITIAHSTVTEAFTGRTLGKRLTACRVVTSTGAAPNLWHVLARNGVKILEMVAYPMLIFMALSPYRQRLGDVVGKTVVVVDVPIPVEPDDTTPKQP